MAEYTFTPTADPCPHTFDENGWTIATPASKVYKDECQYSFKTPLHDDGIFISLKTFNGVSKEHLGKLCQRAPHAPLVLRCKERPAKKIDVKDVNELGIEPPKEYDYFLCCLECKVEMPINSGLTEQCCTSIIHAIAPAMQSKIQENNAWLNAVDCPHCDSLVQTNPRTTPPPTDSKCANCDHTQNNWMCMHCGAIGCPRKEAGGQEHAILHYMMTGHSVVLKLGTVTPNGADLHCYACDEEVRDKKLREHLKFFGIDMNTAVKDSKSLGEMMFDVSIKHDYSTITEEGKDLVPRFGSGYTGMKNFGNSCYIASVLQVLFSIPAFKERYYDSYQALPYQENTHEDPAKSFDVQMEKLGRGIFSGEYSQEANKDNNLNGITVRSFKDLIAGTHRDFSTGEQQDAHEYLGYLLEQLSRRELAVSPMRGDPTKTLEYVASTRAQCSACGKVKYTKNLTACLSLPIPVDPPKHDAKLPSSPEEAEAMRPTTNLDACLAAKSAPNLFECRCSDCGNPATYTEVSGMESFPDVLTVHLNRSYLCTQTYQAKKLDVFVDMPDELDLEQVRALAPQDGEQLMKDQGSSGSSSGGGASSDAPVDELSLVQLISMGIDDEAARWALRNTDNNVERAVEWVFSHPEGPPSAAPAEPAPAQDPQPAKGPEAATNGVPKYELFAMISHIGASAITGHYLAHIKKDDGQWMIYNDEKVAESLNPPKRLAVLYFYRRVKA